MGNKLVAMLRVKDGILFIREWLSVMENLVDEIVVVDNGSTDGTLEIMQKHSKVVDIAQTIGFDEGRDKIMVYGMARKRNPDWCIWLDADEIFEKRITRHDIERMMSTKKYSKYVFRRFHFHKDDLHFEARLDKLFEQSIPSRTLWKEHESGYFRNVYMHNGDIQGISGKIKRSKFRLKHLGAVNREYLERKTKIYELVDKDNKRKAIYKKHQHQDLTTWRWFEYNEKQTFVSLQMLFFDILFPMARIYFFLKRKVKRK